MPLEKGPALASGLGNPQRGTSPFKYCHVYSEIHIHFSLRLADDFLHYFSSTHQALIKYFISFIMDFETFSTTWDDIEDIFTEENHEEVSINIRTISYLNMVIN